MSSPADLLRAHYTVGFPNSFFDFWDFASRLAERGIQLDDSPLGIKLGRAFDAFEPGLDRDSFDPVRESRYPLDPPEFFTMLHGDTDGLHWGYYLDDPEDPDFLVAAYYHGDAYEIWPAGRNLFEAVRAHLEQAHRDALEYVEYDPEHEDVYEERLDQLEMIRSLLTSYEGGSRTEEGTDYLAKYIVTRDMTAPTRDGMGIVVPSDTYRAPQGSLRLEEGSSRPSAEEIGSYLTEGWGAMRAGYPGTALKVAKDLWVFSEHFEDTSKLCDEAYAALERPFLRRMLTLARESRSVS